MTLLVVALAAASACTSPRASSLPNRYRTPEAGTPLPAWAGEPLSWEKLQSINTWLATDGPAAPAFWRVEGRLQLSEGRVEFARREAAAIEPEALVERLSAARFDFERVLADDEATDAQRHRAEIGLAIAGGVTRAPSARPASFSGVIQRSSWGARPPTTRRLDRNGAGWRYITVHHSAMESPRPLSGSLADSAGAVRDIQTAHMNGSGYGDLGYHFVIDPFGRVFEGRKLAWQGAHAGGRNNIQNIGVCLLGNFDRVRPTPKALEALEDLLDRLRERFSIPVRNVKGHRDWKSTECPGRHLRAWLLKYR